MKHTKFATILLIIAVALSTTACSGIKKSARAASGIGYTKTTTYSRSEWSNDIEDGVYITTSSRREIKAIIHDNECYLGDNTKLKSTQVKSATYAMRTVRNDDSMEMLSLEFNDKEDAKKYYENCYEYDTYFADYFDGYHGYRYDCTVDSKEGKNSFQQSIYMTDPNAKTSTPREAFRYRDVYYDGNCTVTTIKADFFNDEDVFKDYEKLYRKLGRDCPAGLSKHKPQS